MDNYDLLRMEIDMLFTACRNIYIVIQHSPNLVDDDSEMIENKKKSPTKVPELGH